MGGIFFATVGASRDALHSYLTHLFPLKTPPRPANDLHGPHQAIQARLVEDQFTAQGANLPQGGGWMGGASTIGVNPDRKSILGNIAWPLVVAP